MDCWRVLGFMAPLSGPEETMSENIKSANAYFSMAEHRFKKAGDIVKDPVQYELSNADL